MQITDSDIIAINQIISLLTHIQDGRNYDRLPDVFSANAVYDCSIFGFGSAVGFEEIQALLSLDGHALAHHCTNIFVHCTDDGRVEALSKGLGLLADGKMASISFVDTMVRTAAGWRIAAHILKFN